MYFLYAAIQSVAISRWASLERDALVFADHLVQFALQPILIMGAPLAVVRPYGIRRSAT
jgi:hypothetical protein